MTVCLGTGFHRAFSTSLPSLCLAPSTSLFSPSISASLSRSIHGRRVWMWIEQQIRSVLIMPVKGGLGEHLSLAPSRNGRSPGSWSPPLLPSRHCHRYQHHQASGCSTPSGPLNSEKSEHRMQFSVVVHSKKPSEIQNFLYLFSFLCHQQSVSIVFWFYFPEFMLLQQCGWKCDVFSVDDVGGFNPSTHRSHRIYFLVYSNDEIVNICLVYWQKVFFFTNQFLKL